MVQGNKALRYRVPVPHMPAGTSASHAMIYSEARRALHLTFPLSAGSGVHHWSYVCSKRQPGGCTLLLLSDRSDNVLIITPGAGLDCRRCSGLEATSLFVHDLQHACHRLCDDRKHYMSDPHSTSSTRKSILLRLPSSDRSVSPRASPIQPCTAFRHLGMPCRWFLSCLSP